MNPLILNRATGKLPDDGWYQIEVPGEHINEEAKAIQVIDAQAIASIVNRFKLEAAQANFAGVLVDKDHFSLDTEKPTEAMGWALELRNRAGIPEARIDWTALGRPLVEGKTYKFFSTVYDVKDVEQIGTRIVNGAKYRVVRPLRLDRLALTNDPNNKGGKPISNRSGISAGAAENQPIATTTMKSVNTELGLEEGASEESAVVAIKALKNRAAQGDALKTERDTLLAAQVDADLEKYKGVIKNRDVVKKQLLANRSSAIEFLEALQEQAAPGAEKPAPITNRAGAKAPATTPTAEDAAAQAAELRASKISNRARAIRAASPGVSLADAYTTAASEVDAGK